MNLYLLTQNDNDGYDYYEDAVVAAPNEDEARQIMPYGNTNVFEVSDSWANSPNNVRVQYLGEAKEGTVKGLITSSFIAG